MEPTISKARVSCAKFAAGTREQKLSEGDIMIAIHKRYGTVDADVRKQLGGLDFVRGFIVGSLPLNTMARTLNYDIVEAEAGRAVVIGVPSAEFFNPEGTVHGGFAATLLDTCMGLAIRSTVEQGHGSTTLEFKINFIRPIIAETGPVRAEGRLLNCGRRLGLSEGRLTDSNDRLLAHGTATCLIFDR